MEDGYIYQISETLRNLLGNLKETFEDFKQSGLFEFQC